MKAAVWMILSVVGLTLGLTPSAFARVETVPSVDLTQYVGTWYEIARNPIIVEPKCPCARQVLTPRPDGQVDVFNSCNKYKVSGKLSVIRGTAKPSDPTGAKVAVNFGFPWKGDYWIIALDSDYRWAAVTDRFGYSLYILARTPFLDQASYEEAVKAASAQVSVRRLRPTEQLGCTYPAGK